MKTNKKKKGFTLIELIVVIAILGILAAILIPKFTGFQDKAKATQALTDAKNIATAIDGWYIENTTWPADSDPAVATSDEAKIIATAGVTGGTLVLETDGGFVWTTTTGGYKAGRTQGGTSTQTATPVKMN